MADKSHAGDTFEATPGSKTVSGSAFTGAAVADGNQEIRVSRADTRNGEHNYNLSIGEPDGSRKSVLIQDDGHGHLKGQYINLTGSEGTTKIRDLDPDAIKEALSLAKRIMANDPDGKARLSMSEAHDIEGLVNRDASRGTARTR